MSAALLDDLLTGFTAPVRLAPAAPTSAKAASSAKREHPCGFAADSEAANGCESLRISGAGEAGFAGIRRPSQVPNAPQSEHSCGSSQDSQDSQGFPPTCAAAEAPDLAAVAWTDGDIRAFVARRARLMRWGWPESEAERLAERLTLRDRGGDDRRLCVECRHLGGRADSLWRCASSRTAGVGSDLPRTLVVQLQRCPGFKDSPA